MMINWKSLFLIITVFIISTMAQAQSYENYLERLIKKQNVFQGLEKCKLKYTLPNQYFIFDLKLLESKIRIGKKEWTCMDDCSSPILRKPEHVVLLKTIDHKKGIYSSNPDEGSPYPSIEALQFVSHEKEAKEIANLLTNMIKICSQKE